MSCQGFCWPLACRIARVPHFKGGGVVNKLTKKHTHTLKESNREDQFTLGLSDICSWDLRDKYMLAEKGGRGRVPRTGGTAILSAGSEAAESAADKGQWTWSTQNAPGEMCLGQVGRGQTTTQPHRLKDFGCWPKSNERPLGLELGGLRIQFTL